MFKKFFKFLVSLVVLAVTSFVAGWAGAKGQQWAMGGAV